MSIIESVKRLISEIGQSFAERVFDDRLYWVKRRFKADRAHYYSNLASRMENAPSATFGDFFEADIGRFPNEPRGILSAYWLSRLQGTNGERQVAFLSEVFTGTVPQEDIALLAVAENTGDIKQGLLALSHTSIELDAVKRSLFLIFGAVFSTILIIHINIIFFAFLQVPSIDSAMNGLLSIHEYGPLGKFNHYSALMIRATGWLVVIGEILIARWTIKALPTYTGRFRPMLDTWFLPFRFYRSFHSLQFVSSLSTITHRVGNAQINLTQGLETMHEHALPWIRSHIEQVLINLEYAPYTSGTVFDTGLFDRHALHWIYDLSEHEPDLSVRLQKLSGVLMKETRPALEKIAKRLNGVAMVFILLFLIGGYVNQGVTTQEFNHQFKMKQLLGQ